MTWRTMNASGCRSHPMIRISVLSVIWLTLVAVQDRAVADASSISQSLVKMRHAVRAITIDAANDRAVVVDDAGVILELSLRSQSATRIESRARRGVRVAVMDPAWNGVYVGGNTGVIERIPLSGTAEPGAYPDDDLWADRTIRASAVTPDGSLILFGGDWGRLRRFNVATGAELPRFEAMKGGLSALVVSPDGIRVFCGDTTGAVWALPIRGSATPVMQQIHDDEISGLMISKGGSALYSASLDGRIVISNSETLEKVGEMFPIGEAIAFVAGANPVTDAKRILVGGLSGACHLVDLTNQSSNRVLPTGGDEVTAAAISDDGNIALCGHRDGSLSRINLRRLRRGEVPSALPIQVDAEQLYSDASFSNQGASLGLLLAWAEDYGRGTGWLILSRLPGFSFESGAPDTGDVLEFIVESSGKRPFAIDTPLPHSRDRLTVSVRRQDGNIGDVSLRCYMPDEIGAIQARGWANRLAPIDDDPVHPSTGPNETEVASPQRNDARVASKDVEEKTPDRKPATGKKSPAITKLPTVEEQQGTAAVAKGHGRKKGGHSSRATGSDGGGKATRGSTGNRQGTSQRPKRPLSQLASIRRAANGGDRDSQYQLARRYAKGNGVKRDLTEAARWYRRAADQGHTSAQHFLGDAYRDGSGVDRDLSRAVSWFRKAANKGDAASQYHLAQMLDEGKGVSANVAEARRWYERAAQQNHGNAMNAIGNLYRSGRGVPRSDKTAFDWYKRAAQQGSAKGMNNAGVFCLNGRGKNKDVRAAARWFEKASGKGLAQGNFNLGLLYQDGRGVPKSSSKAVELYRKASASGLTDAKAALARMLYFGHGVKRNRAEAFKLFLAAARKGHVDAQYFVGHCYTIGAGVEKDRAKSFAWQLKAARQGHAKAQHNVGTKLETGSGTAKDVATAVQWYQQAAKNGNARSLIRLGQLHERGSGVAKNEKRAAEYYQRAASKGEAKGSFLLGRLYEEGRGVRRDRSKAVELYRAAAKEKVVAAYHRLGHMYYEGDGVSRNRTTALSWFRKAADAKHRESQYQLGTMYRNGKGVDKNYKRAAAWFDKAARAGHTRAQFRLGEMYDEGDGVREDRSAAIYWWKRAARKGDKDAQEELEDLNIRW